MIRLCLLLLVIASCAAAQQQGELVARVKLKNPVGVAVDRLGNFYVTETSGTIKKINPEGRVVARHKGKRAPELLEPWNPLRVFAYHRPTQTYQLLNQELHETTTLSLPPSFAIRPWLVCPTAENHVWIMDEADRTLKRINLAQNKIQSEFTLPEAMGLPRHLREYQNVLIVQGEQAQVEIYNGVGNRIKHFDLPTLRNINVAGEDIYLVADDRILFYHLFSEQETSLTLTGPVLFALVTDERLLLVRPKKAEIYHFRF
ncbi:MAG: hypothetical protein MUC38_12975 [Cyclobacteriaceae bacterium]|jgi:streptogramin lyase|nr:hypothetical protein [Cyclobacteriaceae bacterium]